MVETPIDKQVADKPTQQQIVDAATIRKLGSIIGKLDSKLPNLPEVMEGMTSPVIIEAIRSVMTDKDGANSIAHETMALEVRGASAPVGDRDYLFSSEEAMKLAKDGIQKSDFAGIIKEVKENSAPLNTPQAKPTEDRENSTGR